MVAAGPERVGPADAVLPDDPEHWTGAGNGFARYDALSGAPLKQCHAAAVPHASTLAALAAAEWNAEDALPAEQAQPVYLRETVSWQKWQKKSDKNSH